MDRYNFEDYYNKYFDDVYHYLLFFTNNKNEAEDLTQDTFLKVLKNLHSFNYKSSVKTWILSIAKHTCIDHYRKRKIISILPNILMNTQVSKEGIPESKINTNSDWELLQKTLTTLKPHYRSVVILRGLKEYSIRETAEILNCKESKVKVDYHRAIQLMKKNIGSVGEGVVFSYEQESK
ncbi:RNA polymerase sigma factor [Bacillus sp. FJAT-27445]|uniref:RNA polymerase sigma factor n=1 Tax=Bacillus sp. FJAT-27445 TaxID=1679166 RepID=UPI0007438D3B|nr:RNA polymerase sigma factor [Bacillus sp. FJAT-27445]